MRISDVPGFLRGGLFYQSLDQEDEGAFEVPDNCIKNSAIVDSSEDLRLLMRTVQFWGLADIPLEVAEYILKNGEVADYKDLQPEFSELSKILQVKSAPFSEAISTAIKIELGVEVVRLMLRSAYPICAEACEAAATVGDLESLMYLHTEGCPWDERTTRAATCNDHFDCLQYALALRCPAYSDLFNVAAYSGSVEGLRRLMTFGYRSNDFSILSAISGQKLDNVRFLVDSGCTISPEACVMAAYQGDLSCLTFLHERGQELTALCARGAALQGHLPCLVYLHSKGCHWDTHCCAKAAFGGHLNCLKFLHENGCPWNYHASTAAMMGGSWKCLWYIVRSGGNFNVPALMLVNIALLILSIVATICKDRSKHTCSTMYSSDLLWIYNSIHCVIIVVRIYCNDYYTEYVSVNAREKFRICFLLVGLVLSPYCLYYMYTCKDELQASRTVPIRDLQMTCVSCIFSSIRE